MLQKIKIYQWSVVYVKRHIIWCQGQKKTRTEDRQDLVDKGNKEMDCYQEGNKN